MRAQGPRELLGVWVEILADDVAVMFELGERLPMQQPNGWFSYGLRVSNERGTFVQYFIARISAHETTAYTFEFATGTHVYYDPTRIKDRNSTLLAHFPGAALDLAQGGTITGFAVIDGNDVAENIRTHLLP
ncbi:MULTISPECIES: hypothetical protein [unclassified Rathayibacter]|uniref:hypothetical protein n=1 Tax=unclassified Rathayibacter TaxID=2609250 RepID=UPI001046D6C6|nr:MULTISPECIES: hypothetical protein [unclassified Rathayibacter]TCL79536.1 hypothetical protein EDF49_111172 [Rathayibacter sp. PhB192]TCM25195.1 hypothetical protein EDF43_11123 [Rathayibacter sp. PhB179]